MKATRWLEREHETYGAWKLWCVESMMRGKYGAWQLLATHHRTPYLRTKLWTFL